MANTTGVIMKLHIPIELANQIIGYLGTRPYQEVYQLIDGMKEVAKPPTLQQVPPTEEQQAA
jgi:hypothetical protein